MIKKNSTTTTITGNGPKKEIFASRELILNIRQLIEEMVVTGIKEALRRRAPFFSTLLLKKLERLDLQRKQKEAPATSEKWIGIESLSQLRALVGGRFQNLKERWLSAGFPLKEHRGASEAQATLDPDGWRDLSQWILTQGFEARISTKGTSYLFEVKKR